MKTSIPKLDAEFFRRKKYEIIFIVSGVVLLICLLWIFISSIGFLSVSVGTAIDNQSTTDTNTKFNIDALQKIGIAGSVSQEVSSTTATSSQ